MNVSVTVERDGWSRQDSSPFDEVSQGCSAKTAEMKRESIFEKHGIKRFLCVVSALELCCILKLRACIIFLEKKEHPIFCKRGVRLAVRCLSGCIGGCWMAILLVGGLGAGAQEAPEAQ